MENTENEGLNRVNTKLFELSGSNLTQKTTIQYCMYVFNILSIEYVKYFKPQVNKKQIRVHTMGTTK